MKNSETILRAILIIVFVISIASLTLPGNCSASQTYPSVRPIKFIDDPLPKPYTDDGEPMDSPWLKWQSTNNYYLTQNSKNDINVKKQTTQDIFIIIDKNRINFILRYLLNFIITFK